MPLIKDGKPVNTDHWQAFDDATVVDAETHIIVSLERWQAERDILIKSGLRLGVRLNAADQASDLADDVRHLELITVAFPAIGDGRGYSIGRLLRQRHHYSGELRAVGPIVRDQFPLLQRCGFNAVVARDHAEANAWPDAVAAITVAYQPDVLSDNKSDLDEVQPSLVAAA